MLNVKVQIFFNVESTLIFLYWLLILLQLKQHWTNWY